MRVGRGSVWVDGVCSMAGQWLESLEIVMNFQVTSFVISKRPSFVNVHIFESSLKMNEELSYSRVRLGRGSNTNTVCNFIRAESRMDGPADLMSLVYATSNLFHKLTFLWIVDRYLPD